MVIVYLVVLLIQIIDYMTMKILVMKIVLKRQSKMMIIHAKVFMKLKKTKKFKICNRMIVKILIMRKQQLQ